MTQLDLFAAPEPEYLINPKKCGTCVFMNTYLPECSERGLGRCVNKIARSYYLLPENTRPNFRHDGSIEYPAGGSWAYVARDSAGCDKHKKEAVRICAQLGGAEMGYAVEQVDEVEG